MKNSIKFLGKWSLFSVLISPLFCFNASAQATRELIQPSVKVSDKRTALVIGNANYTVAAKLRNPKNDAEDMAKALEEAGFEVISGTDLNIKQMTVKIREFGDKLAANKGVGLFYYAGHGVQVSGINYLIPVDADIPREDEIIGNALELDQVFRKMATANNGFNIVILDACRNNPFARSWSRSLTTDGLAQVNAPTGTLIAYATDVNKVADDGPGRNGLYTAELLKMVRKPNLKVQDTFNETGKAVRDASKGKQIPWTSSSYFGDFYFRFDDSIRKTPTENDLASTTPPSGLSVAEQYMRWSKMLVRREYKQIAGEVALEIINNPTNIVARRMRGEVGRDGVLREEIFYAVNDSLDITRLKPAPVSEYEYEALCWAYVALRKADEAIATCTSAINSNPTMHLAFALRGAAYDLKQQPSQVITDYSKAIEIEPKYARAYERRAAAFEANNQYDRAKADYDSAIGLDPNSARLYRNRGKLHKTNQKHDLAIADFTKAIEASGNERLSNDYLDRGVAYHAKKEYDLAIADFTKALRQNDPVTYFLRGLAYFATKQFELALADYSKAISIDSRYKPPYSARADLYDATGMKDLAATDREQAKKLMGYQD